MNKRILAILTITVFCMSTAIAQDWKSDMEKACRIFSQEAYEVEVEQLFYPSLNAIAPTERQTVWVCKKGEKIHSKQAGMELISDGKYAVMIYDEAKIIGISEQLKEQGGSAQTNGAWDILATSLAHIADSLGLDSIKPREAYKVVYLGEHGGKKSYRFDYTYGEYEQSTVYLSRNGLLERISCIFRQPMEVEPGVFRKVRVELVYRKQESGKKIPDAMFSIDNIAKINPQGEVVLSEKYAPYRLLNNIISTK